MRSLARILGVAGITLLLIGAFVPILVPAATPVGADACTLTSSGTFVDPDCVEGEAKEVYQSIHLGILLIVIAVVGLSPVVRGRRAAMWGLSLTAIALVAVLWLFVAALVNTGSTPDQDWGWGVLIGGPVLIALSALLVTLSPQRTRT